MSDKLPEWAIFYADQSCLRGQGDPLEAPKRGFVLAVAYDLEGRRYVMHSWDYYRWHPERQEFWGHDLQGIIDWQLTEGKLVQIEPGLPTAYLTTDGNFDQNGLIEWLVQTRRIFVGTMVDKHTYAALLSRATNHPDFPLPGYEAGGRARRV